MSLQVLRGQAAGPESAPLPRSVTRLEPSRGWVALRLDDVWGYRELLWFLALRDIKVRYKQTVLGLSWAVLQPVGTALVFTVVFGRLAHIPSDGVPYAVFALAGLVPWTFFASAVSTTALSLVGNTNLISKVYFPRLCVPIATVLASFVDLLVASVVLFAAMAVYGVGAGARILLVLPFMLLAFAAALGAGLWLSAIAARYRDVRHAVPFLLQFWLFATPVAYPSSLLAERWHMLYAINPMVGVVEGFRWSLLGSHVGIGSLALTSATSAAVLLVTGALYFRRMERSFADVI
ncbi:MAG TPA: ABC transporter permease [Mycobacteriales bacterium]|nr:ABC transporter permease [Mycobacteriales bacterium]